MTKVKKICVTGRRILVMLVVFLAVMPSFAKQPGLEFYLAGQRIGSVSLAQLEEMLESSKITVSANFLNGEKQYQGFTIKDVLNMGFQQRWLSQDYSHIAFIAMDGYESISSLDKLHNPGGYIAFRDLDVRDGWEPVGHTEADPGPFFLVWTGAGQTTENAYPWPWQLVKINLIRFEDQYPKVVPVGAKQDSNVYRGFELFRSRCLRCHAIDQQGGKIGPDLHAPQNIVAYRSKHMIKEFIRQPSQYRYTHMPNHTDLSDADLENLYLYLKFKMETRQASH